MYHCPVCKTRLLNDGDIYSCSNPNCSSPNKDFPLIGVLPLLIPFGMDLCVFTVMPFIKYINLGSKARGIPNMFSELNSFLRRILYGVNRTTIKNYKVLSSFLGNSTTRVLIIGGGTIGGGQVNSTVIARKSIFSSKRSMFTCLHTLLRSQMRITCHIITIVLTLLLFRRS